MKVFLFLILSFTLAAQADEQFIEDSNLRLKSGYGNTSRQYFSYDRDDLGRLYRFKSNTCYKGKINKFKKTFEKLEKEGFTYTTTETFINNISHGDEQLATFLVTYVKDTYDGDWAEDEITSPEKTSKGRPADYLIYRYVHFECELRPQVQIIDRSRMEGKRIEAVIDESNRGGSIEK